MHAEMVNMPICKNCQTIVDIWGHNLITNAWQKEGYNYYEFTCPECGEEQTFNIEIEEASKDVPQGDTIIRAIMNAFGRQG